MRERIEISGGSFSIESTKGKRTVIRAGDTVFYLVAKVTPAGVGGLSQKTNS
jgi:hypothetical protein